MAIIQFQDCPFPNRRYVDTRGIFRPACPDGTRLGVENEYAGKSEVTEACTYRQVDTCERMSATGVQLGPNERPCGLFMDGRPGCGVVALSDARVWIAFAGVVAVGAGLYWAMRR